VFSRYGVRYGMRVFSRYELWNARVISRNGVSCGMHACFLGMGLGMECACFLDMSCGMRACFFGIALGMECARSFSVWG